MSKNPEVGVIVGRFQIDIPHDGHRRLIEEVHSRHGKVLICLGCSPVRITPEDPLDYSTRARMFQQAFPWATIAPIDDQPTDELWSRNLDLLINNIFPTDKAMLYGSRKSFLNCYSGKWPVVELPDIAVISGTELRQAIAQEIRDSADFRAGVIYASANRYPISYQVVDMAILEKSAKSCLFDEQRVALIGKYNEVKMRFPGGFVAPTDLDLEYAVRREGYEETGLTIDGSKYLGSFRIDDWRYRAHIDKMMSAFFVTSKIYGHLKAGDDADKAEWVPLNNLLEKLAEDHQAMGERLIAHCETTHRSR